MNPFDLPEKITILGTEYTIFQEFEEHDNNLVNTDAYTDSSVKKIVVIRNFAERMNMKYTIELTDKQKKVMDCLLEIIHRYIGFNPKFEMYREPEVITKTVTEPNADAIYEQGFEDGKNEVIYKTELIPELKKVEYTKGYNSAINDYNGMIQWLHDCTGDFRKFMNKKYGYDVMYLTNPRVDEGVILYDLICDHDIAEVISEFKKWQEEKKKADEIKAGDVVKFNEKCHNYDHVKSREFLVLHIFDNGLVTILYDNGDTGAAEISLLDKTGRHFDQVEQILSELKMESEEK